MMEDLPYNLLPKVEPPKDIEGHKDDTLSEDVDVHHIIQGKSEEFENIHEFGENFQISLDSTFSGLEKNLKNFKSQMDEKTLLYADFSRRFNGISKTIEIMHSQVGMLIFNQPRSQITNEQIEKILGSLDVLEGVQNAIVKYLNDLQRDCTILEKNVAQLESILEKWESLYIPKQDQFESN